jgi:hypothetical protein
MRSLLVSFVPLLVPLAVACGSSSEAAGPAPAPVAKPAAAADDHHRLCVEVFTRNRTCTDTYIPALVDARAKYDRPPGIADAVKKDRNAVIAEAKGEWAEDSKDEAIGRICQQLTANMTDEGRDDAAHARECLAHSDCAAYTACVMPLFEKRFAK